jgi:hypothetical protein
VKINQKPAVPRRDRDSSGIGFSFHYARRCKGFFYGWAKDATIVKGTVCVRSLVNYKLEYSKYIKSLIIHNHVSL